MKTFLGSLGSNPSLDIFRAELLAIGDIQPQLSYFIQDTTKNFSFCNKNIKSGKAWFLERVNSRKDLATTHLLFALDRCVTFPLRTLRSCGTLLQESFMLHMTWSLQTEEQALSRSGGEAQAEEQQIQGPWTRADLAHVREVAGRPVWLEWREQWDSSGDQWGGRCERFSKCRAEPTFSKCRFSEKDLGFSLTSENTERFWTVEKHDLTNFMRSLCCPLKQSPRKKEAGRVVRRLLQSSRRGCMVTGMGNQRGDCGDDEKWSRSGNASKGSQQVRCWMWLGVWEDERGPASLAWDLEGWSCLGWNKGDSQSSRLERERKWKNGISGGDSWILRCLLVLQVEILNSGGCSRRNWVESKCMSIWTACKYDGSLGRLLREYVRIGRREQRREPGDSVRFTGGRAWGGAARVSGGKPGRPSERSEQLG